MHWGSVTEISVGFYAERCSVDEKPCGADLRWIEHSRVEDAF